MDKLAGVHPTLVEKVKRILAAMDALGFPMLVIQGVRTAEQQAKLYAQGRTAPGHVVTNADGIFKKSNHQIHSDGFGYAIDLAFQGEDPFNESHPWALMGMMAVNLGLIWGGNWISIKDKPHVELHSA